MVFMRWGLQNFASVRPTITRPGTRSPINTKGPVDLVIVRECLEGEYPAREGELDEFNSRWPDFKDVIGQKIPPNGKFALRVITEVGVSRITDVAIKLAQSRAAKRSRASKVTIVTKANILSKSDGMFLEIAKQRLKKFDIEIDELFIDEACRRLIISPEKFDIILSPNLFGDIMSSITSELGGGIGVAPSAVTGGVTPYYESVHGSAPDIAGQGIANPLATVLSAKMMLEDLSFGEEAMAIENAVAKLLAENKILTRDLGGRASTNELISALIAIL